MKRLVYGLLAVTLVVLQSAPVFAKQIVIEENSESTIMLDVARRYYPMSEIKQYIDALSVNANSSIQMHFTEIGEDICCCFLARYNHNVLYNKSTKFQDFRILLMSFNIETSVEL